MLGAAVGVEYRASRHATARFGRRRRRYRDVRRHSPGERPAHHHAGVQVDDRREVQPPLAGAQVRDVAHELVGGHGAGEVAPHQVGPGLRLGIRDRSALPRVGRASAYPRLAHQFARPVQGEAGELAGQEALHEPEAEPAVRLQPHAPDRLAKLAVLGFRVGPAGKLAPAVLHPFVHGLGIQAELCAAFRYRPARRDYVVGGLSPELVGVLGGWVWQGIPPSRSSLNAF